MAKDKVGPPGAEINKRSRYYMQVRTGVFASVNLKDATISNGALRAACGILDTKPDGVDVYRTTEKRLVSTFGFIPFRITYEDDGIEQVAKMCASPEAVGNVETFRTAILAANYHGTLSITDIKFGW
ncbi:MAG: hypothetical protein ACPGVO_04400 [Spirulinaceae cyanobacterium]